MPKLEDYSIFADDEDVGAEADMPNLDTTIQEEPKKVIHALKDPSWIEAMQEELLQFKLQEVWTLMDLPNRKGAIGNDIIFGSTKKELCNAFEKLMHEKFQMSSMGELTFFLGLQVGAVKFTEVKTASTPIETQKPLLKDENGEEVDVHMYRSMIGSLMYLTFSRPDIMCLKGQPKLGLWYPKDSPFDLVAYTDSDYARASLDRKSITGDLLTKAFDLQALMDGKKIIITESTVRRDLQLEDAEGVDCLLNATIFEQLALMGPKTTAWNEFSSTMASAIICLATNKKFNFSKFIFESMVKNLDNVGKFLIYPRFVQVFLDKQLEGMSNHNRIYVTPSHTKKIFGNMRRVRKGSSARETPLFQIMVVQNQAKMGEGSVNPTDSHHTPTFIQPSTSQPQKKQKPRKPKRNDTQIPQSSGPTKHVADEAVYKDMHITLAVLTIITNNEVVYKELDDSLVRAATTTSSLEAEQESGGGPRCQETMEDTIVQTRFKNVSKLSNDTLLARGNTLQSGEDSLKLNELMELCTNLQQRVLDLETTKTTQANEIASLKKRVKKLKHKKRSRTHRLKRLYKVGLTARVESFRDEESLGEDASKQGRINAIDADEDITLVNDQDDADMFDVNTLTGDEVLAEQEVAAKDMNLSAATITNVEITLAQALAELKSAKPKADKVVIQEPEQGTTTITPTTIIPVPKPLQDKGKGIIIEEPVVEQVKPMKRLEQMRLDEELAFKL
ncbi:hypothetical protein Tco_1263312 [Tanacetum coccineum]